VRVMRIWCEGRRSRSFSRRAFITVFEMER